MPSAAVRGRASGRAASERLDGGGVVIGARGIVSAARRREDGKEHGSPRKETATLQPQRNWAALLVYKENIVLAEFLQCAK